MLGSFPGDGRRGFRMQWGRQQPVIRSGTGGVGDFKRSCMVKAKSTVRNLKSGKGGDREGQGSLVCHRPWGHKEVDMIRD